MKTIAIMTLLTLITTRGNALAAEDCAPALDFDKRRLAADEVVNFCEAYQGKVVLIVNTASECAFTGQYEGLEALYRRYKDRGFTVLGFPSNDFGNQEPGTEKQIQTFCRLTYSVEFPMFEKISVKEGRADPLFRVLAEQAGAYRLRGARPSWKQADLSRTCLYLKPEKIWT